MSRHQSYTGPLLRYSKNAPDVNRLSPAADQPGGVTHPDDFVTSIVVTEDKFGHLAQ